jgi:hypothetical protein
LPTKNARFRGGNGVRDTGVWRGLLGVKDVGVVVQAPASTATIWWSGSV